ncbi:MAG: DUF4190 domain-containing protein [Nocardioidaceae bacterium]
MDSTPGDGTEPVDPDRRADEPGPPGLPYPAPPPDDRWAGGRQQDPPGYGPTYPSPYGQPGYPVPPPNHSGAVAAMVVGIVSLVLACGYGVGLLGSPVALVLGRRAMRDIDASQGALGGRGMAQAGLILGIVGTVLLVLLVVAAVVLFGLFAGSTTGP